MKQITIKAPEGYEFLVEDGKPAFRLPLEKEWYLCIKGGAVLAMADHSRALKDLPMYILIPKLELKVGKVYAFDGHGTLYGRFNSQDGLAWYVDEDKLVSKKYCNIRELTPQERGE